MLVFSLISSQKFSPLLDSVNVRSPFADTFALNVGNLRDRLQLSF